MFAFNALRSMAAPPPTPVSTESKTQSVNTTTKSLERFHAQTNYTDPLVTSHTAAPAHWNGVLPNALAAVGQTPLIQLGKLAKEENVKCQILAKAEFFSAGGSIKDRIAKRMIEHAEKTGRLIPGRSVVIEPTSGNTGIGLALAAAIKGYKCIIVMPEKMSKEKEFTLRALGAEIVRTPTDAPFDSPESHIGVAKRLAKHIKHAVILDQYANEQNSLAHYYGTFPEILASIETSTTLKSKNIDVLVAGAGTGGTITGLSKALRDHEKRSCIESSSIVVAVDPEGSILGGGQVGMYQVEGIGYDFFPDVLDTSSQSVDQWIKTEDEEAFSFAKRAIRTEGLLVGGSSGSALAGLFKFLKTTPQGQAIAKDPTKNVVVILPDGIRNYMSKPWFLEQSQEESSLSQNIQRILEATSEDDTIPWDQSE